MSSAESLDVHSGDIRLLTRIYLTSNIEENMSTKQLCQEFLGTLLAVFPRKMMPSRRFQTLRQRGFRKKISEPKTGFYSQYGQDAYIWNEILKQQKHKGTFVDIGAYDGVTFSNTAYFEKAVGWSGLLVEPNPDSFSRLIASRSAECVNCGIGPNEAAMEFLQCTGYGAQLSCFPSFASPEHLARIEHERVQHSFTISRLSVPVRAIGALFCEHQITSIDVLSVDVEGMELDVLRQFPFRDVSVHVASIESNSPLELEILMEEQGFRLRAVLGADHIYVAHTS
ncbi:MAG TPA: FkbM family methyltransferase [Planctomycetaceae bacterium]|nr:FkbM family methyltransferase [Planctomycetaceae bacterium]